MKKSKMKKNKDVKKQKFVYVLLSDEGNIWFVYDSKEKADKYFDKENKKAKKDGDKIEETKTRTSREVEWTDSYGSKSGMYYERHKLR